MQWSSVWLPWGVDLHKIGSEVGLDVRWRVTMAWLNNRRKQMRVIQVEFINSNFPGLINRVRRKIVLFPSVLRLLLSLAILPFGDVLSENVTLPKEMSGFVAYETNCCLQLLVLAGPA